VTDFDALIRAIVRDELAKARPVNDPAPALVTIAAYAARRSISVSTVRAAVKDGRLPAQKVGRAVRVPADVEICKPATPQPESVRDIRSARILGLAGRR
jgi:excisionase family DNA binding protein